MYIQKCPVDVNRERIIIVNLKWSTLTNSSWLCKGKIDKVTTQFNVSIVRSDINEHLFVEDNLSWVIDWNFLINLHIHGGERLRSPLDIAIKWISAERFPILVSPLSIVDAHYNLMPVDVNVPLHQWHGLCEHVVAGSNEVNIENLVITNNTEDSFVVISTNLWEEFNNYSCLWSRQNRTFSLGERENVGLIRVKLECGGLVAVIDDIK